MQCNSVGFSVAVWTPLTFIVWAKTVKYNVFLEPDPSSTDVSLQQKL